MEVTDYSKAAGHWILAKMGKKVLRPGGKEMTMEMIKALKINKKDHVVEFAPGLGYTAELTLKNHPQSYIGIDADTEVVNRLSSKMKLQKNTKFIESTAEETTLESESKDKLYGEAMLTMHADQRKERIIKEAHRVLKKGGVYAIHEMGLQPDSLEESIKNNIQKDLATSIRVNARPLTVSEWKKLLEKEGFRIKEVKTSPMHLLKIKRIVEDEGWKGALTIGKNILFTPEARKRIVAMSRIFKKYESHLNSVMIIAEKN